MSFEDIRRLNEGDYLDLTPKKQVEEPKEEVDIIKENNTVVKPRAEEKKKDKKSFFIIIISLLLLISIGVSAYNFYILKDSSWECFTDKCIEYYDKPSWLDTNCKNESGMNVCRFRYQNQDQSVLRSQLEEFPADHSIFCKSFSCDTQILRRAG